MTPIYASYFDGESSSPRSAELEFDQERASFRFNTSKVHTYEWPLQSTTINSSRDQLILKFGTAPQQSLKITDQQFIAYYKQVIRPRKKLSWHDRWVQAGFKVHLILALGIIGFAIAVYFVGIPYVADRVAALIPIEYNKEFSASVLKEFDFNANIDSAKTKILNDFAQLLDLSINEHLNFTVANSKVINAFALPDGNIVVFSGLLDRMRSHEELVGLICHEVVHVTHRHSMKMVCRNVAGYLFISLLLSDINGMATIIVDNARSFQSLSYSRAYEREADTEGVQLMLKNHISPVGMKNLLESINEQSKGLYIPEFLLTHPVTKNRIESVNHLLQDTISTSVQNEQLKTLFATLKSPTEE